MDKPGAAAGWTFIASHREDVPVTMKARANSLLARGWLDLAQEDTPGALNISYLHDAGKCANEAAALGLVSPAVLLVASKIEAEGFRRPEDNRFPEHSTEKFEQLTDLWEVWDARKAELAEEDSKKEAKVSKDPLSYFCAAEDCGITATKKSTLWRCGGECPREFKPSYCSKYCQTAVRFLSRIAPIMLSTHFFLFPSRIASTIGHTAERMPRNRVSIRSIVRARPPSGSDRIRLRGTRTPKSSSEARSGPLM